MAQHVKITAFEFKRFEVRTHLFPVVYIFDSLDSQALGYQWIQSFKGPSFLEPIFSQNDLFAQNEIFMTKTTAWFSCTALFSFCKIYMIFLIPSPFTVQNFEEKKSLDQILCYKDPSILRPNWAQNDQFFRNWNF